MIDRRWEGEICVVAATGPSLSESVAEECLRAQRDRCVRIIAVNDAYRLLPFADVLYAADVSWWNAYDGVREFLGEKWSIYFGDEFSGERSFDLARRYGLKLAHGLALPGFSLDARYVHGCNSGYHAINLAILFGATPIILTGFNMQRVDGKPHFFGDHPAPLRNDTTYSSWVPFFDKAKEMLPRHIRIVNATPNSAIKCFETKPLHEALRL